MLFEFSSHFDEQLQCSGTVSHQAFEPVPQLHSSRKILKHISVIKYMTVPNFLLKDFNL